MAFLLNKIVVPDKFPDRRVNSLINIPGKVHHAPEAGIGTLS